MGADSKTLWENRGKCAGKTTELVEVELSCSAFLRLPVNHVLPIHFSMADLASFSSCEAFFGGGRGCWVLGQRWSSRRFRRVRSTSGGERTGKVEKQGTSTFMFGKWLGKMSRCILDTPNSDLCIQLRSSDPTFQPRPLGPWTSKGVDRNAEMTPATLVEDASMASSEQ